MSFLSWVVVGFVAGVLAKGVTGVRGIGCLGTIVVGVLGALLGGILFKAAGSEGVDDFSLRSLLVAIVGATVLLLAYNVAVGRGARRR